MTKFEKTMKKAETLQSIYNAVKRDMELYVCWEDQEVFKALEKML